MLARSSGCSRRGCSPPPIGRQSDRATTTSAARATAPPVPLTADPRRAEHFASRSNNIRCPEVAPPGKGLRGQSPIYCSTHSPTSRCMLTHAFLLWYTRQLGNDAIYLGYRTLSATRDVEVRFPATRAQRRNLAYRNRRRSSNVRQLYATVWMVSALSLSLSLSFSHTTLTFAILLKNHALLALCLPLRGHGCARSRVRSSSLPLAFVSTRKPAHKLIITPFHSQAGTDALATSPEATRGGWAGAAASSSVSYQVQKKPPAVPFELGWVLQSQDSRN